jgi:pteridine reductase
MLGLAMKDSGGGAIVQIGDWSAHRPYPRYLAYTISKGALETATMALARELAPHVRVNMVALGPILLPDGSGPAYEERVKQAVPLGRLGGTQAFQRAVLYLLEDEGYCTGTILTVDGGRRLA